MKIITLLLIFFVHAGALWAGQKTAHVDFNKLVQESPDAKAISDSLAAQASGLQKRVDALFYEAQRQADLLEKESTTLDPSVRTLREKQVQEVKKQALEFRESAQAQLKQREKQLLQPLVEKVKNAVKAVAKKLGYDYVIDSASADYVVLSEDDDITEKVKKYFSQK